MTEIQVTNARNSRKPLAAPDVDGARGASVRPARVDVAVIGAGQAGLAIGYFLARQGRQFVILEAADAVGAAWRERWDSLLLFTPRRYDALPGLAFPGDPDGYPTRGEVIAYLEQYAAASDLPIEFNSAVRSLHHDDGTFRCIKSAVQAISLAPGLIGATSLRQALWRAQREHRF